MFRKKSNIVFQVTGRERGHLEAYRAQIALMNAQYLGALKQIMEREKIEQTDAVSFDADKMVFVRTK